MHELAVTENILNIATKHAQNAKANKVTDIYIVIGKLASIVDDSVQFYWDMISQDTICAGALLHFERLPAEILCENCGNLYAIEDELTTCPACFSPRVKIVSGDEFYLDSIDIEK